MMWVAAECVGLFVLFTVMDAIWERMIGTPPTSSNAVLAIACVALVHVVKLEQAMKLVKP